LRRRKSITGRVALSKRSTSRSISNFQGRPSSPHYRPYAYPIPKASSLAPEISTTVDDRQHIDSLSNDSVDDAVATVEYFSDVLALCLRYNAARRRKRCQPFGAPDNARDEISGMKIRVGGDVVAKIAQVLYGGFVPEEFHSTENILFTSSCGTTRPSSAALIPNSMFFLHVHLVYDVIPASLVW